MILIADCGSTKIDWCLVRDDGRIEQRFETPGLNASLTPADEIAKRLAAELAPALGQNADKVGQAFFYGAGCLNNVCANVANALQPLLPNANIEVASDLLAAARALCGHKPGIACILGTGSNSCFFNGAEIEQNVSPLGYILGDEGSGAVLGKLLVGNVLKAQLPSDLCQAFLEKNDLTLFKVIERVYRQPGANRWLASLSPFLKENIERPEVEAMVVDAFMQFFKRNVANYAGCGCSQANFVGSIAHYYEPQLRKAAQACGFSVGTVLKSPMQGLIAFHTA